MKISSQNNAEPSQNNAKPSKILTWLKSTFGNESTSKTDDKKRTFRGVVAAMRVIYGFKGKNDTRQSGMFFTKHIGGDKLVIWH